MARTSSPCVCCSATNNARSRISILNDSLDSAAAVYRTVFDGQAPLIRFLNGLEIPVPKALKSAAEIAINNQLQQASNARIWIRADPRFASGSCQPAKSAWTPPRWSSKCASAWRKKRREFAADLSDLSAAERMINLTGLSPLLPFPVVLWEAQNLVYRPLLTAYQQNGWHASTQIPLPCSVTTI